jgi:hypothetical protein
MGRWSMPKTPPWMTMLASAGMRDSGTRAMELLEGHAGLEAREVGADAAVWAGAEGEVAIGDAVQDDVGRLVELSGSRLASDVASLLRGKAP